MPFSDILGHEREIDILRTAILKGRIAHTFLFCGQKGIGKRLTALSFAKAINCDECEGDFCGRCQSCRTIEKGRSLNLLMVEPTEPESKGGKVNLTSGSIRISDIRRVQHRLSFRVEKGKKIVCIIDGAEKITTEAANAFLKTLEEPPLDAVIILIVNQASELLPTMLSRCQRINFSPLKKDVVQKILREWSDITPDRMPFIAGFSGGSLETALNMSDSEVLGKRKNLIERLNALSFEDMDSLFKLSEEISKNDNVSDILKFMKIWYRDMAVFKEGDADYVINSDLIPLIKKESKRLTFARLWNSFKLIDRAEKDILPPRYANKQLTVEVLLMDLIR